LDLWTLANLPDSLRAEPVETIRDEVDAALRDSKVVATHYQHVDGTSFAAPIVASVVALMLEINPRLGPAAVKYILISAVGRIHGAPAMRQGFGVLSAARELDEATREQHDGEGLFFCPPRIAARSSSATTTTMRSASRWSIRGVQLRRCSPETRMESGARGSRPCLRAGIATNSW
jgi:hypothetical protein